MNAAESTPALGASLNISGANFGIALGAFLGSRVIDLLGLAQVSVAAAVVVVLAIVAAAFAMLTLSQENPRTEPVPAAEGGLA